MEWFILNARRVVRGYSKSNILTRRGRYNSFAASITEMHVTSHTLKLVRELDVAPIEKKWTDSHVVTTGLFLNRYATACGGTPDKDKI